MPDALKAPATSPAAPLKGRDLRLDLFRGLALITIMIDHVPGTLYEHYTLRNWGFSDAAEAFVFMSGLSAGLAYAKYFAEALPLEGIRRTSKRAFQIYLVQVLICFLAVAVALAAATWFAIPEMLEKHNIQIVMENPLIGSLGLATLYLHLGYFDILPLYFVLILAAPIALYIGQRQPLWLLLGSIALWALSSALNVNLVTLNSIWFLNPFCWQLIFVIGLLAGMGMKKGKAFVPYHPLLFWISATLLAFILLWRLVPDIAAFGRSGFDAIRAAGVPNFISGFSKQELALPRLLHALMLFYVVASIPAVVSLAALPVLEPVRKLGRNSLPVFATGSVLCIVLQTVKIRTGEDPLIDGLMLAALIIALVGVAEINERRKAHRAPVKPLPEPEPEPVLSEATR